MSDGINTGQELREHCVVSLLRSVIDPTWGVYDWTCEEGYFYLSVYIKERPALIFFLARVQTSPCSLHDNDGFYLVFTNE